MLKNEYMKKQKIILDMDPGHDDAFALMLAVYNESLDLLLATSSAGNQTIEKTSRNALNLLRFFDSSLIVAKGETNPIKRKVKTYWDYLK